MSPVCDTLSVFWKGRIWIMQYELKNQHISATVDTLGAELISMVCGGREYIWTGDPDYWNGHNPILFPVIGFLKDDLYRLNGKSYPLQKHGFARKSEFTPLEKGDSFITLELTESPKTLASFPFRFRFLVTHRLTDRGFRTEFTVANRSEETMYFQLGGHTGFTLPFTSGAEFSNHKLIFDRPTSADRYIAPEGVLIKERVKNYLKDADTLPLSYDLFDRDALMLDGLESKKVRLCDNNGNGVEMDFAGFSTLGIWTPKGKMAPFVCIEPWNGMNAIVGENCEFSGKPRVLSLDAGREYRVSYGVSIL